jgi:P-type conjugative transfer protein TrbG
MTIRQTVLILLPVGFSLAQTSPQAVVPRQPATVQQYPFGQAAAMVQQGTPTLQGNITKGTQPPPIRRRRPVNNNRLIAPTDNIPSRWSEMEGDRIERAWQQGNALPTGTADGAVQFRYSAALPPVVCAPERLTSIFLQPGETIHDQPGIGDSTRWLYTLMSSGEGATAQTVIVIKPMVHNIRTDFIVATNRRTYQFELIARPDDHMTRVEFSYPDDERKAWEKYQAEQAAKLAVEEKQKAGAIELTGEPNFDYTLKISKHHKPKFIPKTVYDQGGQTYLKMPKEAINWQSAVLQIAGVKGCEIVNYRVSDKDPNTWIIDRLFDSATLISGTGKKADRVVIMRDGVKNPGKCGKGKTTAVEMARTEK